jgi:hypothetical protein
MHLCLMPYIEGWWNEKDTRDTILSTLSYHPERLAHCNSTSHLELLCVTFSSFNFRVWHTNLKMASTDRKFILNFILGTPFQHFLRSYQSHSLSQQLWLSRISGWAKALVRPWLWPSLAWPNQAQLGLAHSLKLGHAHHYQQLCHPWWWSSWAHCGWLG